jgi:hypothetical protein
MLIIVIDAYARPRSIRGRVRDPRGARPRGVFGGPPAPSCMGANIVFEQGKPGALQPMILVFYLNYYFMF